MVVVILLSLYSTREKYFPRKGVVFIYYYILIYTMMKEVKAFGRGAHVLIPKEYLGKTIEIRLPENSERFLTSKEITNLIEIKIEEAKGNY